MMGCIFMYYFCVIWAEFHCSKFIEKCKILLVTINYFVLLFFHITVMLQKHEIRNSFKGESQKWSKP